MLGNAFSGYTLLDYTINYLIVLFLECTRRLISADGAVSCIPRTRQTKLQPSSSLHTAKKRRSRPPLLDHLQFVLITAQSTTPEYRHCRSTSILLAPTTWNDQPQHFFVVSLVSMRSLFSERKSCNWFGVRSKRYMLRAEYESQWL